MTWRWTLGLLFAVVLASCTKDNPHACAEGDPCTDPARPFCDLDGLIGGVPGACIAVTCTPGDFAACDSDRAIQCNATGDNYETVLCERGCDPASDGCRLCNPDETACTNGVTATCDASGAVVAMEPCPLGCFEDQPRCRELAPSNDLDQFLDMAEAAADLTLTDGQMLASGTGLITNVGMIPSVYLAAPPNGVPIRVFPVRSLTVTGTVYLMTDPNGPQPAVAFVSHGDVVIDGNLVLGSKPGTEPGPPPGSFSNLGTTASCMGQPGAIDMSIPGERHVTGGGGGGHATAGGRGAADGPAGGAAGSAYLNDDGQPLRGGCAGGDPPSQVETMGWGGGALQITSRTLIELRPSAIINANGMPGDNSDDSPGGGGSGGAILLEAPEVRLETGARLLANGGSGASGDLQTGVPTSLDTNPTPGAACLAAANCGRGGSGGAGSIACTEGEYIDYVGQPITLGGAGGGAYGHIRINTRDGSYTKANDAIESPAPTTAIAETR